MPNTLLSNSIFYLPNRVFLHFSTPPLVKSEKGFLTAHLALFGERHRKVRFNEKQLNRQEYPANLF